MDELRSKGKIAAQSFPEGIVMQTPLLDPSRPPVVLSNTVKVPIVGIYLEVCAGPECGAIYCSKFEISEQEMPVQFQQMPRRQGPR